LDEASREEEREEERNASLIEDIRVLYDPFHNQLPPPHFPLHPPFPLHLLLNQLFTGFLELDIVNLGLMVLICI